MVDGVLKAVKPKKNAARLLRSLYPHDDCMISQTVRIPRGIVTLGDAVFYKSGDAMQCGMVKLIFQRSSDAFVIVTKWVSVPREGAGHARRFAVSDDVDESHIHPMGCLEEAVIWARDGNFATVLVSPLYRAC